MLSYSLLYVAIFLIFNFVLQARRFKNLPPGPPSLPIIGNLNHLKRPLHRTFKALSEEYGPIISLWFGSRLVVIVSSPSVVKECFTINDVVLANRPRFLSGKYLAYNCTTLGTSSYGEHWRNLNSEADSQAGGGLVQGLCRSGTHFQVLWHDLQQHHDSRGWFLGRGTTGMTVTWRIGRS